MGNIIFNNVQINGRFIKRLRVTGDAVTLIGDKLYVDGKEIKEGEENETGL